MRLRAMRAFAGVGIIASLAVLATIVGSAPIIGSGTGQIPLVGGQQEIWPPSGVVVQSPPPRYATRVSVTAGKARVRDQSGLVIGMVPEGFGVVFEGTYSVLSLEAMLAPTDYSFECRGPTDGSYTGPDRLIGQGTVPMPPAGGTFRFYGSPTFSNRLVLAHATVGPVTMTDGSTPLWYVDPDDWTFCSKNTRYFGVGCGAPTHVDYSIYEMGPSCGPLTGTAKAQVAGDTDGAYLDGGTNLSITLTNNGPGTVTIAAAGGSPAPTAPLGVGQSFTYVGNATQFQWTYSLLDTTVSFSVLGQ